MQFEEQSVAQRQMKELLRDQAKFRERLERVVRKIETSSERTAKLAERRKGRGKNGAPNDGEGNSTEADGQSSGGQSAASLAGHPLTLSPAKESP